MLFETPPTSFDTPSDVEAIRGPGAGLAPLVAPAAGPAPSTLPRTPAAAAETADSVAGRASHGVRNDDAPVGRSQDLLAQLPDGRQPFPVARAPAGRPAPPELSPGAPPARAPRTPAAAGVTAGPIAVAAAADAVERPRHERAAGDPVRPAAEPLRQPPPAAPPPLPRLHAEPAAPEQPSITVTIGGIDVVPAAAPAVREPARRRAGPRRAATAPQLGDYLRERDRR